MDSLKLLSAALANFNAFVFFLIKAAAAFHHTNLGYGFTVLTSLFQLITFFDLLVDFARAALTGLQFCQYVAPNDTYLPLIYSNCVRYTNYPSLETVLIYRIISHELVKKISKLEDELNILFKMTQWFYNCHMLLKANNWISLELYIGD